MTTGDLLVRGGLIVDGTGRPARAGDVRVRGGLIAEVGDRLRPDGEPEIDAAGAYVAPGFIDTHTHFDPTLFWDRRCDPMPEHGVTSVLVGNCSLSLAPVRDDQRDAVTRLFCYVEDLPEATFTGSIPFTWRTYGEYLDALGYGGSAVNVATLVGHTPLRLHAMGDEAWERAATRSECEAIAELLNEALGAGAFGLSTSLGFDTDPDGRPAPSQFADDDELGRLADVLAASQRFLQFIPTPGHRRLMRDVQRVADITGPRHVTSTWIGVFDDPDVPGLAVELLDFAADLQAVGVPTHPQASPRTLDIQANWDGGMSFSTLVEGWHKVVQADRDGKRRLLEDPAWRATARAEWDQVPRAIIPHKAVDRIRLMSANRAEDQRWVGATLADLVAERGGHPSDVLADWVLANDLAPSISVGVANSDPAGVAETLRHPAAVVSNSDAGAHVQMMCAAGDTTLLLTRHVRDRQDLSVEQAVHALTSRQAELFGFEGRGMLAPGALGDLVVFVLDELSWEPDVPVRDLPAGASRLRRPPGGYRATVVGGVVTQQHGQPTEALPGTVLRRGVTG